MISKNPPSPSGSGHQLHKVSSYSLSFKFAFTVTSILVMDAHPTFAAMDLAKDGVKNTETGVGGFGDGKRGKPLGLLREQLRSRGQDGYPDVGDGGGIKDPVTKDGWMKKAITDTMDWEEDENRLHKTTGGEDPNDLMVAENESVMALKQSAKRDETNIGLGSGAKESLSVSALVAVASGHLIDGGHLLQSQAIGADVHTTSAPTYPQGPFKVVVQYELHNDCGLTGALIMNEDGNTLKQGLIAATTTVTVRVLNETYPRAEGGEHMQRNVRARGLAHLDLQSISSISSPSLSGSAQQHRNLVYYTGEYPVVIDRIIDNTWSCAPGLNCLLATSTITVVLEPGDDGGEVSRAVVSGMQSSFKDESFLGLIPEDTVICP